MTRDRVLVGVALAAVAGLSALVVMLFALDRGGDGESPRAEDEPAIEARAVLSPPSVLFGDTVTALVEVTLDRNFVDPDSVGVEVDFSPWTPVADPEHLRRDANTTTYIRTTYMLRCLVNSCTSTSDTTVEDFGQAQVTYTTQEGTGSSGRSSLQAPWPQLVVNSRYAASATPGSGAPASRWRADLLSLSAATYSVGPGLLVALLLAGGTLLAIGGSAFAYLALPRRAPPRLPKAPPEPVVTPLERALALLEDPARVDGAGDQRRALELVAKVLVEGGDMKLARTARAVAWSAPVPGVEETSGLAARARAALGEELHEHPE